MYGFHSGGQGTFDGVIFKDRFKEMETGPPSEGMKQEPPETYFTLL